MQLDLCPECFSAISRVCPNCGYRRFPRRQYGEPYPHPVENERIANMGLYDPEPLRRYPNGTTNLVKELPRR